MIFNFYISPICIVFLCLTFIVSIIMLTLRARKYNVVVRRTQRKSENTDSLPDVSILVYSNNDSRHLAETLPLILSQEYSGNFEVIILDDSFHESTKNLYLQMGINYPNLAYTFVPTGTVNLSRKKLAIMLGIKAAKYDIILNTVSNCAPRDNQWLSRMMSNFDSHTDVVLGFSRPQKNVDKAKGNLFRQYDFTVTAAQYLSAAISGNPYRGDGNNIAYRKKTFFDNGGFSRNAFLNYGDDDVFVNIITNEFNTKVEISPKSQLIVVCDDYAHDYEEQRLTHRFTLKYIPTSAKWINAFISWLTYIYIILSAVTIACDPLNGFVLLIIAVIGILIWILSALAYNRVARCMARTKLWFTLPFFALWRPISNCIASIRNKSRKRINFSK